MKRIIFGKIGIVLFFVLMPIKVPDGFDLRKSIVAQAQAEWVNGYFRSNGNYVNSYYRTHRDGIVENNLSFRGY